MGADRAGDSRLAYADICDILQLSHGKGAATKWQTLNRVFRKNYERAGGPPEFPTVFLTNMTVTLESWPIKTVLALVTRPTSHEPGSVKGVGKKARHFAETPVIVARFEGKNYLMDGNRRVQHLAELGRSEIMVYACLIS